MDKQDQVKHLQCWERKIKNYYKIIMEIFNRLLKIVLQIINIMMLEY